MIKICMIPLALGLVHVLYLITAVLYRKNQKTKLHNKKYSIEHIVCFRNESNFIKKKLENCYALNYENIHHTFVNDNSTDDTLALLNKYSKANTKIVDNNSNRGKNQSQIKAVKESESDFILFTDANVFLNGDAVTKIVNHFNEAIGGITGNVTITTDMKKKELSGKYWQLEKIVKRFQSCFGTVIGFDGGFYCVKRENYNVKRENELSDFETAFLILEQQKQTKYADDAVAVELEKRSMKSSFKARMRASNRVFWSYYRIFKYCGSLNKAALAHFVFHKLVRYMFIVSFVVFLPVIILTLYGINSLILVALLLPPVSRFVLESIALFVGGVIALGGKEFTTWSDKKA